MENQEEVWKDIDGYEGLYQVSNLGRVKSLPRFVRNKSSHFFTKEKILKPSNTKGYSYVSIRKDNIANQCKIHRLVCLAFLPNPENKRTVNHINGIRSDNRLCNLEWATDSENLKHSYDYLGRISPSVGKYGINNKTSKKIVQLNMDGSFIKCWDSRADALRSGFSRSITACCKGKELSSKGFRWMYLKDYETTKTN
jgi:hypothetical protein